MGCISTMSAISELYELPNGWNEEVENKGFLSDGQISFMGRLTLDGMIDTMPNALGDWQAPYRSALVDTFYWFDPFAEDKITSNFIYAYNYYRGSK